MMGIYIYTHIYMYMENFAMKLDERVYARIKKPRNKYGRGRRARTRTEFGTINKRHLAVGEFDSKLQDGPLTTLPVPRTRDLRAKRRAPCRHRFLLVSR